MNDLDARVAALKPCPFCGGEAHFESMEDPDDENFGGEFIVCKNIACHACSMMIFPTMADAKPLLIEKWNARAELQKPALHEPITEEEVIACLHRNCVTPTGGARKIMRHALESFLQGRAKPAQEEITDGECYRWLLANDGANACHPAIQSMWANCKTTYPSQQEWDAAIRAAIRASKGEKT